MILHIPHAKIDTLGRKIEQFDIDELTDFYTDDLFQHENSERIIFPYSRFICDVERFEDEKEPLYEKGQGICYTKGTRNNSIEVIEEPFLKSLYKNHHNKLNKLVSISLSLVPLIVVVDCHSFSDKEGFPDFCIGTNIENTPKELVKEIIFYLEENNYSVKENYPFSNAIIPTKYINNKNVKSIMIEVNKKNYLNKTSNEFLKIKKIISKVLDIISKYEIGAENENI